MTFFRHSPKSADFKNFKGRLQGLWRNILKRELKSNKTNFVYDEHKTTPFDVCCLLQNRFFYLSFSHLCGEKNYILMTSKITALTY